MPQALGSDTEGAGSTGAGIVVGTGASVVVVTGAAVVVVTGAAVVVVTGAAVVVVIGAAVVVGAGAAVVTVTCAVVAVTGFAAGFAAVGEAMPIRTARMIADETMVGTKRRTCPESG